jgi:hypothetical protein
MADHPFYDVARTALKVMQGGATIHQKWSCEKCGVRQHMPDPNKFFTHGKCEKCNHVTDLVKQGCNYMVIASGEAAINYVTKILEGRKP